MRWKRARRNLRRRARFYGDGVHDRARGATVVGMSPLLYSELTSWYRLVDPPQDHADEAEWFRQGFERAATPGLATLLELGAGAGHNALHMKQHFACTLTDLSPHMLQLSRELNPECEHVLGDMRELRLGRTFDAVLVHDAVVYMTSEGDLRAMAQTAFAHTRPGGAAIIAPDCTRETFRDSAELLEGDDGARSMRGVMWSWDPDPNDDQYTCEFGFLLRDAHGVRAVHDTHIEGLFSHATWVRVLSDAGYRVQMMKRPIGDGTCDDVFLCSRPA